MVRRNYAKGCTKELGIYNNKREALTIEQQGDSLEFVEHGQGLRWYYNLFVFFFETGCRCGESIGLTWSDVDFQKRFIKIDHQFTYELDESDERRFQVTDPKTIKSIRKIANAIRTDTEPVHRECSYFTQLLHRTAEKIQNHLKTYNFSYPF